MRVIVNITTEDGELLERFNVKPFDLYDVTPAQLAAMIHEHVGFKFEEDEA